MATADLKREVLEHSCLIMEKIGNLRDVGEYLYSRGLFNKEKLEAFQTRKTHNDQCFFLINYVSRRGEFAFDILIDALVSTEQFELAKALNPRLNIDEKLIGEKGKPGASGDGNCLSSGSESGSGERKSSVGSNHQLLLEPPSAQAIRDNENFYKLEKEAYIAVPQTDGILSKLLVTQCKEVPPNFSLEDCYPNLSKPKGLALIFNNRRFEKQKSSYSGHPLAERIGTDVDCKNLERLFKELGYHVNIKIDLTAKEMLDAMARFSFKSEHERCHSAVVIVLSHGTHGQLYGADGELVPVDRFVSFLNAYHCPALKNKPKLFIIQACRGDRYDDGVDGLFSSLTIRGDDDVDGGGSGVVSNIAQENLARADLVRKLAEMDEVDANSIASKTPSEADILIAYATTPGYVSWRNTMRGSWFVQAICEIFARDAHQEEILHLFTAVNRRVAEQLSGTGHKQVPEPSSRLTKKFYFLPGL